MVLELGDSCCVRCRTSDLICELDFKTKVNPQLVNHIISSIVTERCRGIRDFSPVNIIPFVVKLERNLQGKYCMKYQVNGQVRFI